MAQQQEMDFNRASFDRFVESRRICLEKNGIRCLMLSSEKARKDLLKVLFEFKGKNETCWPSLKKLRERKSASKRGLQNTLNDLEEMGLIEKRQRFIVDGNGLRQISNEYRIDLQAVFNLPATTDIEEQPQRPSGSPQGTIVVRKSAGRISRPQSRKQGVQNLHPPHAEFAPPPCKTCTPGVQNLHPNHSLNHQGNQTSETHEVQKFETKVNLKPALGRDIKREDLRSAKTALKLYQYTVDVGYLQHSEDQRLTFLAFCRYAARKSDNPGGYLTSAVRLKKFEPEDQDLDAASDAIREHVYGEKPLGRESSLEEPPVDRPRRSSEETLRRLREIESRELASAGSN